MARECGLCECCGGTYGEVLGDIVLDETDISSVTGASSLLVSLVLVASGGSEGSSGGETSDRGECRCERDESHEEEDDFGEHDVG